MQDLQTKLFLSERHVADLKQEVEPLRARLTDADLTIGRLREQILKLERDCSEMQAHSVEDAQQLHDLQRRVLEAQVSH